MLENLIEAIKSSGTTSATVLAKRMNTSPKLIEVMLDTLEEQGYIQTIVQDCNPEKPCDSCTLANLCSTKDRGRARVRIFSENLKKA